MGFRTGQIFSFLGAAALLTAMPLGLSGCGNFFVCQGKASCPSSGSGGGTTAVGNYVYVADSASGTSYVDEYQVGAGTLTAVSGSPFNLTYTPRAMVVSENNAFLFVAADPISSSGVYAYPINSSTGALSSGTDVIPGALVGAMAISPDGNFLFVMTPAAPNVAAVVSEYQVNASTGALSLTQTFSTVAVAGGCGLAASTSVPATALCAIAVSPSENFVGVSLGTTGSEIAPYSSSGGMSNFAGSIAAASSSSGDFSLAFDTNGFAYIGRSLTLASYDSLSSQSPSGPIGNYTFAPINSVNATPRSVVLTSSSSYEYVYTADQGTSQISSFSVSSGAFTPLNNALTTGPTSVSALGVDRSGTYLLAAGYNATSGLQMFTITSNGLTSVATKPTGTTTTVPMLLTLTH